MRVALAAVLFSAPDLLLLDEPTNYLDLEGALWLDRLSQDCPATTVVISHDRDLLDDVVDHILHLERGKLTLWSGGYSSFERQRREQQALAGQGGQEAGGATQAPAELRRPLPRQGDQGDAGPVAPEDAGQDGADRGGGRRDRAAVPLAAGRQEAQPADRRHGEGQRRLRRARRAVERSTSRSPTTTASGCSAPTATASRPSPSCSPDALAPMRAAR